jgi:hypothetical protein
MLLRRARRARGDRLPGPVEGWNAAQANSLQSQLIKPKSVTPAKPPPDRWPTKSGLVENKFVGELPQREIHECTPTVWPKETALRLALRPLRTRRHATLSLLGARIRECWCRPRSSAPPLVYSFSNLLPSRACEAGLKSFPFERCLTKFERASAFALGDDLSQALLD